MVKTRKIGAKNNSIRSKKKQGRRLTAEQTSRHLEKELLKERTLIAQLMETSPVGITFVNVKGKITYANARAEEILGLSKSEIIRREYNSPAWRMTDIDGNPYPEKKLPFRQVKRTKKSVKDVRHAIEWPNGKRVFLSINGTPLFSGTGKFSGMLSMLEDITELNKAEEALLIKDHTIASTINGMAIAEFDGNITYVNRAFLDMWGYESDDQVLGRPFVSLWKSGKEAAEIVDTLYKNGSWFGELTAKRKNDSLFNAQVAANIVMDKAGKAVCMMGSFLDITERKRAEEALRASEERFHSLYNNTTIGLYRTTPNGRILMLNPAGLRMLGYKSFDEIEKRNLEVEGYEPGYPRRQFREEMERNGIVTGLESAWLKKDGSTVYVRESATAVRDDTGRILYYDGTFEDITERKRTEEALRESEEQYRQLVEQSLMGIGISRGNHVVFANPALLRIFGYENHEEFTKMPLIDHVAPTSREEITTRMRLVSEGKKVPNEFDYNILCRDGKQKTLHASSTHLMMGGQAYTQTTFLDITERKQMENALRESEERFQMFMHFFPGLAFLKTMEGRILFTNEGFNTYLGLKPELIQGKTNLEVFGPEFGDKINCDDQRVLKSGRTETFEEEYGGRKWSTHKFCIHQPGGSSLLGGITLDITERKRAEEELANIKAILETAFNQTPIPMVLVNADDYTVRLANFACLEILGIQDEYQELGQSLFELKQSWQDYDEHGNPKTTAEMPLAMALRGIETKNVEYFIRRKDGSIRWELVSASPIRNVAGKVIAAYAIFPDITDRKNTENRLRQSEEELKKAQRIAHIGNWKWYIQTNQLEWSDEMYRIFGIDKKKFSGDLTNIFERNIHPDDLQAVKASDNSVLTEGKHIPVEYRVVWPDQSIHTVWSEAGELIYDNEGHPYLLQGIVQDITERKLAEDERGKLVSQLLQTQKLESIGVLAAGIAHDFNNILNIIMGNASILASETGGHQKLPQRIDAISRASERGSLLVKQLLTFARKTEIERRSVVINDLIQETVKLLEETFPRTIEIILRLKSDLPVVSGDSNQLHQVLMNLCVNSRDAMPFGGRLTITTDIVTGEYARTKSSKAYGDRYVSILVKDSGMGMDEETVKRIFDPFFTTKEKGKGTGLGLAVVMGIIENHDGIIDVHSRLAEGTEFRIYLPGMAQVAGTIKQIEEEVISAPGGDETILFVEDEKLAREMVSEFLKSKGYTVLSAGDGEAAVKIFKHHMQEISIVLTDLGLPKCDGEEVCRSIRNVNKSVPVVMMSGFINPGRRAVLDGIGVNDLIMKPYKLGELLIKIREVLDRSKLQREE
jgi:two-component system cell cycle sensor histidine kinase/response regulator CckA